MELGQEGERGCHSQVPSPAGNLGHSFPHPHGSRQRREFSPKGWMVLMGSTLFIPKSPGDTWEKQELHQSPRSSSL